MRQPIRPFGEAFVERFDRKKRFAADRFPREPSREFTGEKTAEQSNGISL